jgi:hypothetical protein
LGAKYAEAVGVQGLQPVGGPAGQEVADLGEHLDGLGQQREAVAGLTGVGEDALGPVPPQAADDSLAGGNLLARGHSRGVGTPQDPGELVRLQHRRARAG